MIPDFMPVLSKGAHTSPTEGACVMELVSYLAGEPWSDSPACTHPALARMAQVVNDRLPDSERHVLVPLIGRLFGTAEVGTEHERRVLSVRLAAWCARQVLPLVREQDRAVAAQAIDTALLWCEGKATERECQDAAYAANAAYAAAYAAANAAAYAAYAANAANAAAYAANAAAYAANDLVALLTGLLDEYDRLTGRTEHRALAADEWKQLAELTA